MNSGL